MNRTWRYLLGLFFLSLAVRLGVALLIRRPGYMDAAYYAAGAVRLAQSGGLSEPFIWNYLDDPTGIPHPGFLYWMPFPSLLAAPLAALFPDSFFTLQLPFALLSALLPLVAFGLAWEVTGRRRTAWLAGLLTLFSGFFFPYWPLPETFAPFALFGSLALWLAGCRMQDARRRMQDAGRWLLVGLLVGLAHLTRADGILLLPVVILPLLARPKSRTAHPAPRLVIGHWSLVIIHCSFLILGYLLVMSPWFLRNLSVIGTPLSPAGAKTLWLTTYDDLFCYNCDLSLRSYLAWGWGNVLHSKLWAAWVNFERFLAEDCLIFLCPFALVGLYRLRRHFPFALSTIYLLLVYLAHSLAFTFPGPRGGFFHASAAVLPFLFAAGVEGLEAAVGWAARRRRWSLRQAQTTFVTAAVVGAVALSAYATAQKLLTWREADAAYPEIGQWLTWQGAGNATVMIANPPAFWYHTGHPAVVVPNEGVETLLDVCGRYGVSYLVLDPNCPAPLRALYEGRIVSSRLAPVATFEEGLVVMWRIEQ